MKKNLNNISIIENPFVQDALSHLRDDDTNMEAFRYYSDRLCRQLLSSTIQTQDTSSVKIQTPLGKTPGRKITTDFVIVAILRSGIAMLYPALQLLPRAKVGFAGIYRDESTALPHEYYWKIPHISSKDSILILDPMLATGRSVLLVIRKLQEQKPKEIRIISIVAAPKGVKAIHREFPHIKIFLASLDSYLNQQQYIVPGLGDFGDRYFGTPTDLEAIKKGEPNSRHWYE